MKVIRVGFCMPKAEVCQIIRTKFDLPVSITEQSDQELLEKIWKEELSLGFELEPSILTDDEMIVTGVEDIFLKHLQVFFLEHIQEDKFANDKQLLLEKFGKEAKYLILDLDF